MTNRAEPLSIRLKKKAPNYTENEKYLWLHYVENILSMLLFNLLALVAADPIGMGGGLDCNFDQLISGIECNLANGFNVRFFS